VAELSMGYRQWRIEVRFAEGEAPDTKKSYGQIVMRPYAATMHFSSQSGREPELDSVELHGHRINKGGLGAVVNDSLYSYRLPGWLVPVVNQAKEMTNG
jgi:hypothetical protein